MDPARFEAQWLQLSGEVLSGFREWREQHPTASLTEIEAALDERLGELRARMLEDAALASASADLRAGPRRPPCPACGTPTHADGRAGRHVLTRGDRHLALTRSRARCPACGAGFPPPR